MSRVQVDDSAPGISYSGSWQTSQDSQQFGSSSHFTTSSGASATINFTGNLIRVLFTNPAVPDGVIRADFILDGKVTSFTRTSHLNTFYRDQYFFANGLSQDQQHTLVVRNTGTQVPLHLDYFEIEGGNVVSVPTQINNPPPTTTRTPPPTTNAPRPTPSPTQIATRTVVETSVEVVTSGNGPSPSAGSQSVTPSREGSNPSSTGELASNSRNARGSGASSVLEPSSDSTNSGSVTVTAFQMVTTSISGVAVVTTIGSDGGHSRPSQGQTLPTGAIIGIIIGSLFFIGLIGVLAILLLRRRRRNEDNNSVVRQRLARHSTGTSRQSPPAPSMREVEHEGDVEAQSTNASSVEPPPRLSLGFMRTLHEKSRPPGGQELSPIGLASGSTVTPLANGATPPNAYAPSFRSSYPLSLPEGAPPAYSSVRLSNAPSSTQAP
ncbi:hypothetical protein BKA70DRAFT_1430233 [Coprinopsis sp. MPI-PUGE-AT-0042]|nr:hypothetical protein BKA70DRAFT_1430233 [Coprinopsis sp. MPI-PUGE-AT-0042]